MVRRSAVILRKFFSVCFCYVNNDIISQNCSFKTLNEKITISIVLPNNVTK